MKDLKIILENVDDICEKFELEGLHTHPTYKQFKRLFTELNKIAEPVQLVSYATDMSTCTLTNGDGIGYFYDRVDPDQPAQYTAVDMANAARDGFRDGAACVVVELPQRLTYDGRMIVVDKDGEFLEYCDVIGAIKAAGGRVKDE